MENTMIPREILYIIIEYSRFRVNLLCISRDWLTAFQCYYNGPRSFIRYIDDSMRKAGTLLTLDHFRGYIKCKNTKRDPGVLQTIFNLMVFDCGYNNLNLTVEEFFEYAEDVKKLSNMVLNFPGCDFTSRIYSAIATNNPDILGEIFAKYDIAEYNIYTLFRLNYDTGMYNFLNIPRIMYYTYTPGYVYPKDFPIKFKIPGYAPRHLINPEYVSGMIINNFKSDERIAEIYINCMKNTPQHKHPEVAKLLPKNVSRLQIRPGCMCVQHLSYKGLWKIIYSINRNLETNTNIFIKSGRKTSYWVTEACENCLIFYTKFYFKFGQQQTVWLFSKWIDANKVPDFMDSVIDYGSINGYLRLLKLIYTQIHKKTSEWNISLQNKLNILYNSAKYGNLNIFKLFAPITPGLNLGIYVVIASRHGRTNFVKHLVMNMDASPGSKNNDALISAASRGHIDIVDFLLNDPRVKPWAKSNRAIRSAIKHKHRDVFERLMSHPYYVNQTHYLDNWN